MASKTLNRPNNWQKQVNPNTRRMKQLMQDVRANVERRTRNSQDLDTWMEKLSEYVGNNCFSTGIHATDAMDVVNQIVGVVDQTSLPSGSNAEILKGTMAEKCYTMVTNVGEDIRTELRQLAINGYNERLTPQQLASEMANKIDSLSKTRCQAIARTETCRAANIGNYINAREMGAKSYSVICNDGCCEYCQEVYGTDDAGGVGEVIFDIEDTDSLPPFHPNCRCTPVWSMDPPPGSEDETSETNEELENEIISDNNLLDGEPEIFSEIDKSFGGANSELTVYKYDNIEIAFDKNINISHEEVFAHIKSLPEVFNNSHAKRIIINTHSLPNEGGHYSQMNNYVRVFNSDTKSKDKILDVLTHELSHSIDINRSNLKYSNISTWEKIFKADNKLYTYVRENGRKRTPNKFPTEYAGKSWLKFKRNKEPSRKAKKFVEDFAESTKKYLNPKDHNQFVKDFPNRAKYLESIYGKPTFDKNAPLYKALVEKGLI